MLEHLLWHAVHAAAPVDDKEAASHILQERARSSPWHAPYAQRPPPQAAGHAGGEVEAPGAAPGACGAAPPGPSPRDWPPCPPCGPRFQHPMAPAHPGDLAARADPAAMLMWDE